MECKIPIVNGDLLQIQRGVIIHSVNCQKVMGAGLAKVLRNRYPKVYSFYMQKNWAPGDAQLVNVGTDLWVANCAGQDTFGRGRHTLVWALENAIRITAEGVARHIGPAEIYIPFGIGCGLGGASWPNEVRPMLNKLYSTHRNMVVVRKV